MKSIRFVSVRGVVGRSFVLAFLFWTALLAGCAVFSPPSSTGSFSLDAQSAREAGAMALCSRALLAREMEAKKGTNANPAAGVDDLFHAHVLLPDNVEILAEYLTLADQCGRFEEAYRCLSAYLSRHPDSDGAFHQTAAHFADRAGLHSEAADACARSLAFCPTNREIADARVRTLFEAGRDREALRALRDDRAYFRDKDATNSPLVWAYHFQKVRKEPARALPCLELYRETCGDDPRLSATILSAIGEMRCLMGQTNAALRIWRKAFRLSPGVSPARLAGGVLAEDPAAFARLRKAARAPDAGVAEQIQYAEALLHLPAAAGEATNRHFSCGFRNLAESESFVRAVCARADSAGLGEDEELFHWRLLLMDELLALPHPDGAAPVAFNRDDLVKAAREMIARFPKSADPRNFLAYYWAERGENLDEAHKLANEALALEPSNGGILDTKGWILYKLGRPYQALQFLLKAAEAERNEEIFQHVAAVLRSLGRTAEAEKFEKALK